jgi:hypothetical protein
MVQFIKAIRRFALTGLFISMIARSALALYVPSAYFGHMDNGPSNLSSTLNHPFFELVTPFPSQYVLQETNIQGALPPYGTPGNDGSGAVFEHNEHLVYFVTNGEAGQTQGHQFQRHEAWDIAFDMKIQSPNASPRKEAGMYFETSLGNFVFLATTNDGFYTTGPGTIGTIYSDEADKRIPGFQFSGGSGPLGDYNHNGTVDAADYTIWRDTLGTTDDGVDPGEDMRANGNNEGASMNHIDQADYDVWKNAFGQGSGAGTNYHVGDTLRMRMIYTPPVLFNPNLPDVNNDPNVMTPGTMEYVISLNGGAPISSGPLPFQSTWLGIPNGTKISMRVQDLGTNQTPNDSSTVTFNNFDFNGSLPGSGLPGAGAGSMAGVPEPSSVALLMVGVVTASFGRLRRRS